MIDVRHIGLLMDLNHHWWVESMKPAPDAERDIARANAALAWAFLQAELRAG